MRGRAYEAGADEDENEDEDGSLEMVLSVLRVEYDRLPMAW
jgi:hypothetical protein